MSGKSTNLVKEFANNLQTNPNSLIITPTQMMIDNFSHKFGVNKEWLAVSCPLMPKKGTYVYIDEYFHLDIARKKTIFNLAMSKKIVVCAVGTPVKSYNIVDVQKVKAWRKLSNNIEYIDIIKSTGEMIDRFGEDLMYSLLVLPDIEIIEPTANRYKMVSNPKLDIIGDIWE